MPRKNQYIGGIIGADPFVPTDEHWDNVSLLIRGDTVTDLSGNQTPSAQNGAAAGNGQYKYSTNGSLFFDGSNDYINAGSTDLLNVAGGDWTIEAWVRLPDLSPAYQMVSCAGGPTLAWNNTDGLAWQLYIRPTTIHFAYNTASDKNAFSGTHGMSINTWHHVAVSRDGSTFRLFVDGSQVASNTGTPSAPSATDRTLIGIGNNTSVEPYKGNIEDFRITKGVARYTGAFDPPEASFPTTADPIRSSVSSLGGLSGDGASTTKPTRRWGGITGRSLVERLAGANVIDHSLRFDGSGDYLTQTQGAGDTQKMTFSAWLKTEDAGWVFSAYLSSVIDGAFDVLTHNGGLQARFGVNGNTYNRSSNVSGGAFSANEWHHVVWSVDTTSADRVKIYVDGSEVSAYRTENSGALPLNYNTTAINNSGATVTLADLANYEGTNYQFGGQLAEVHFIDGQALTASDFGENNASGQWVPKEVTGVTYGTNGFYLPFSTPSSETNAFNAVTYTGDGTSSRNVTGVGFDPDFVWIKNRDSTSWHQLADSVRGDQLVLSSNSTDGDTDTQNTNTGGFYSLITDGFRLEGGSQSNDSVNANGDNIVAWCFKAGGAPTATNNTSNGAGQTPTSGSVMIDGVASTAQLPSASIYPKKMSVNTDAGFSIVQYGGTGLTATIPHGLSSAPDVIIIKDTTDGTRTTDQWPVYHSATGATGDLVYLHQPSAGIPASTVWVANPTADVFTVGSWSGINHSNDDFIAYCWRSVPGFSKFGSYSGSGGAGNKVTTGFKPAFVIIKSTGSNNWVMIDNKRSPTNPADEILYADSGAVEATGGTTTSVNFLADGFDFGGGGGSINSTGSHTYIYMAFADTSPNLGLDTTTNSNNFTVNGNITPDDQLIDTPNLRFATLDPSTAPSGTTLSNANLTVDHGATYGNIYTDQTITAGKYYCEVRADATTNLMATVTDTSGNRLAGYWRDGNKYNGGASAYASAFSSLTNPIIGVALNADTGTVWFSLNGVWQKSANPANFADATDTNYAFPSLTGPFKFGVNDGYSSDVNSVTTHNFGQDHTFAGSEPPLTSPFTDADGNGEFYYEPPPGFKALATTVVASDDTLPTTGVLSLAEDYQSKL